MRFFDRKYKLQIGDSQSGAGISIENSLQLTFSCTKSVNNKKKIDKCSVTVYNLSDESLTFLETDYPVAIFSCGYENQLVRLFYGEVVQVETRRKGTDRVTKIDITPAYTQLTHTLMSEISPENTNVEDVIESIRKQTNLVKGVYKGSGLSSPIVYGYPLNGTPREMLDKVCGVYSLEWRIEGESLYINDAKSVSSESKELAPVISEKTGLIDRPYFFTGSEKESTDDEDKVRGIKFKALLNPNVIPTSIVRVDYRDESKYYRVEEVQFSGDFRGNNWTMVCTCSERPEA